MGYILQFGPVFDNLGRLLDGALMTLVLSVQAMVLGLAVAIVCAFAATQGPKSLRWLVAVYVEGIRNTPLLVQLFVIFFGLPELGIKLTPNQAALLGIVINLGAYATEIVRAGIESVPRGQVEAGLTLGLTRLQVFRFIVFYLAVKNVFPSLSSQFVLVMLGTSIVSTISADDLSGIATSVQSETFRPFEVYAAVGAIYIAMALALRAALAGVNRALFARGTQR